MRTKVHHIPLGRNLLAVMLVLVLAWLAGCETKPVAAIAPAAPEPTRAEKVRTALKAMSFVEEPDGWHLSLPAPLVFEFDSDTVASHARDNLLRIARELRELGIDRTLVRGHTDNVGTRDYNLGLSKRRADAVAKVLTEGGFPADRVEATGLGFSMPLADNATAEGRAKNRRVVIIVQIG